MPELDGIMLLLAKIKFAGKDIGLISEQGVQKGGSAPEFLEIVAAQTRTVVKRVLKKAGTIQYTFRLIELKVANLVDVLGGSADAQKPGKWNAPPIPVVKEGHLEIEAVTGQIITAAKATLSGDTAGTIGGDDPYGVECTITVEYDGVNSPFSIDNTAPEEG